jgi:hypothetical protein
MPTVTEGQLGAVNRPQPERASGHGELHRPRHRVVIGQRQRRIAVRHRHADELLR